MILSFFGFLENSKTSHFRRCDTAFEKLHLKYWLKKVKSMYPAKKIASLKPKMSVHYAPFNIVYGLEVPLQQGMLE